MNRTTCAALWCLSICFALAASSPPLLSPPTSLRGTAQGSGILVGAAVRPAQLSEPAYAATLAREFDMPCVMASEIYYDGNLDLQNILINKEGEIFLAPA